MIWLKSGQRIKIRQQTLQLVSHLSRWCQVREDLVYAFEKSLASGLEDPMRQAVADLLVRIRGGMSADRALDMMQQSIRHENFRDLITAIRFNFRHRGDLPALLEQLEIQLHRLEEEYDRRRLSNARDMKLTLLILAAVPILFLLRLMSSGFAQQAFLTSSFGMLLLLLCLLFYIGGIAGFLLIKRRIGD